MSDRDRNGEYERRKQRCREAGICFQCRGPHDGDDAFRCNSCIARRNESRRKLRSDRTAIGLCACGQQAAPDHKECAKCQQDARDEQTKRRQQHWELQLCLTCGALPFNDHTACYGCFTRASRARAAAYLRQQQEVIEYYGGKCACCPVNIYSLLEVDHINNDGAAHRQQIGRNIYAWLIKNRFPDIVQLLCSKCNRAKHRFDVCPHQISTAFSNTALAESRQIAIAHYGGVCVRCPETNWAFLEFDHINNDGKEQRALLGRLKIAEWLIKQNYPTDIQLLCTNCNRLKWLATLDG